MRRKDREVTDFNEIVSILEKCDVVRLGMYDGNEPYIVPLNYGYKCEGNKLSLYFHSAIEGRKVDILREYPNVCFEADCSFSLIKGEQPCTWSAFHESVMGKGKIRFIDDVAEKTQAMDCLMKRYGFEGTPKYDEAVFKRTLLYVLEVSSVVGKKNIPSE